MTFRPPKIKKVWIPRPFDPQTVAQISRQTGVSSVVAQVLAGRGIQSASAVTAFLEPPNLTKGLHLPEMLPGCMQAASLIIDAMKKNRKITIYGDYDVDGMTATAILVKAIQTLGGHVNYYVPNRLDEGYGLNCETIKRLHDDGTDIIITVDCGITSLKEAAFAKEIGLDLIITDHHTPITAPDTNEQILPDAMAIVHPRIRLRGEEETQYPCPELCGAMVAFKLAWALGNVAENGNKVGPEMKKFLIHAVGLAALGTVADVVPLQDENRTIVRYALANSLQNDQPLGLKLMIEAAGMNNKKRITSEDIGYSIAPRLNAAGREVLHAGSKKDAEDEKNWKTALSLLTNPNRLAVAGQMGLATLGVELIITDRIERARELAPFINNLNETRQKLERKIMSDALKQIEKDFIDEPAFVLASRDWHPGVIGIVAGRLAEMFFRPTVMIALKNKDPGTGSGRGVPDSNFSLYDAFSHCSEFLERFGGHAAAAGLGINEANIDRFRTAFCDYVSEHFADTERVPKIYIDGEFPFSAINYQTATEIEKMAPFGSENPRPVFAAYEVSLVGQARRIGTKMKVKNETSNKTEEMVGRTFSAKFRQFRDERRAVAFGAGDWVDEMNELVEKDPSIKFDLAFQVMYNDYFGQVELRLQDWRVSE
ncbi:MAG: DHHA1 domain-containing protein [Planctomycetia bacterium]|nr:DHHA1 domain-containing protein [Planctomycetia bacterium]